MYEMLSNLESLFACFPQSMRSITAILTAFISVAGALFVLGKNHARLQKREQAKHHAEKLERLNLLLAQVQTVAAKHLQTVSAIPEVERSLAVPLPKDINDSLYEAKHLLQEAEMIDTLYFNKSNNADAALTQAYRKLFKQLNNLHVGERTELSGFFMKHSAFIDAYNSVRDLTSARNPELLKSLIAEM